MRKIEIQQTLTVLKTALPLALDLFIDEHDINLDDAFMVCTYVQYYYGRHMHALSRHYYIYHVAMHLRSIQP